MKYSLFLIAPAAYDSVLVSDVNLKNIRTEIAPKENSISGLSDSKRNITSGQNNMNETQNFPTLYQQCPNGVFTASEVGVGLLFIVFFASITVVVIKLLSS